MTLRRALVEVKPMAARRNNGGWSAWVTPNMVPKRYLLICCDCGFAHWFQYRVRKSDGAVQWRAAHARGYTRAIRARSAAGRKK